MYVNIIQNITNPLDLMIIVQNVDAHSLLKQLVSPAHALCINGERC